MSDVDYSDGLAKGEGTSTPRLVNSMGVHYNSAAHYPSDGPDGSTSEKDIMGHRAEGEPDITTTCLVDPMWGEGRFYLPIQLHQHTQG